MASPDRSGRRPGITLRDGCDRVGAVGAAVRVPAPTRADARYGPTVHVVRGLRQAVVMLAGLAVLALVGAGVWVLWRGGAFRPAFGMAMVILAGVLAFTGGTVASRAETNDINAFLGWGPDREDPATGASLTAVGIFLFVSLPLFVVGGFLYGTG
jgi:hypothetical protein